MSMISLDQLRALGDEMQDSASDQMEAQLDAARAQIEGQYKVAKLQARTAANQLRVDKWYKGESLKLLRRSAALEKRKFGLERSKFRFEKDMQRSRLGLDILKTGVEYAQKPADYVMASNWAQGVAGDPRFSAAVEGLLNGKNARLFGAASGAPQAANLGQLAGMYAGTGTTGTTAADQLASSGAGTSGAAYDLAANAQRAQSLVQAGSQLVQQGGQSLAPQSLESMDPTTLGLTQAGVTGAGGDWESLLRQYSNAKPGQASSGTTA